MGLLKGKKALIFGVANEKSIAWAIAEAFREEGAEVALAYANDAVAKRVIPLAESIGAAMTIPCDVRSDEDIKAVFAEVDKKWGGLDILVHSIAFAPPQELRNPYVQMSRAGWHLAMDISVYSLVAVCRLAAALMTEGGSIITVSYYGGEKVVPGYNIMGI